MVLRVVVASSGTLARRYRPSMIRSCVASFTTTASPPQDCGPLVMPERSKVTIVRASSAAYEGSSRHSTKTRRFEYFQKESLEFMSSRESKECVRAMLKSARFSKDG